MPRMDEEPGRKRRLAWLRVLWAGLVAVVLAGVLVGGWFFSGTDAFKVDGVPFREWVAGGRDFEIRGPLAKLGTNAVPHLVRILRRRAESPQMFQLRQSLWKPLPGFLQALDGMGTNALPATEALRELMTRDLNLREVAIDVLNKIDPGRREPSGR